LFYYKMQKIKPSSASIFSIKDIYEKANNKINIQKPKIMNTQLP
jgi:hypothetical protein